MVLVFNYEIAGPSKDPEISHRRPVMLLDMILRRFACLK
jgi:hypothetical protein